MSHQYHRLFDPEAQDSLAKLARLVRPGSEVLDLGAGPGVLATYLMEERACYVDGIEYDPASAEQGQRAFRSLWVADLNLEDPAALVGSARYDFIVCADILEHLIAPEALLCRLYLGWDLSSPGLTTGRQRVTADGAPAADRPSIHYWFHATQVLHHVGGPRWNLWNERLRELLVGLQESQGPNVGSWEPRGEFAAASGRLATTALAVCTLEVYYRQLPVLRPLR